MGFVDQVRHISLTFDWMINCCDVGDSSAINPTLYFLSSSTCFVVVDTVVLL